MSVAAPRRVPTATHWGAVEAIVEAGRVVGVAPFAADADPSPIIAGLAGAVHHPTRVRRPAVRASWLADGPAGRRAGRGAEPFVEVSWARALDLVAAELGRVREAHGNRAIYAGSYGWGSAGRFHSASGQLHRLLNLCGGYTGSINSYSCAAAIVTMPHVVADWYEMFHAMTDWRSIAENSELVVALGGLPLRNAQVIAGGCGSHTTAGWLRRCRERGVAFVNVGPIRDDADDMLEAEWLAPVPNSDVALMLGMAHTLVAEGRHDRGFLARHCVGFERFRSYLCGEADGEPKTAEWAAARCGLAAEAIRGLARRMAAERSLLVLGWSLQRADHGEQVYWMAVPLAAMLGQIGLPGGGFAFGLTAVGNSAQPADPASRARLPQGDNPTGAHRRHAAAARPDDRL